MGRVRASFGFIVGALALGAGLALRGALTLGLPTLFEQAALHWAALALALAAVLSAWVARPPRDAILEWGLLPVAALVALAMPGLAVVDPERAQAYLPGGLEAAGGFALIVSALRFLRAQAERAVAPLRLGEKKKVRLIREGQKKRPEVPAASLVPGDRVELKAGGDVPADGRVVEGEGFVDEAVLLGPGLPTAKKAQDPVFAGTRSSAPELVVEVARPLDASLLAQRERAFAPVAAELARADRGAWIWAGALAVGALLAGAAPGVGAEAWPPWGELVTTWAALALAVVVAAPALAAARARLAAAALARRSGLILSRGRDLEALMRAQRWQVDPHLLAAPGKVEVVAYADTPADTLLAVADALLSETFGPEQGSVRGALAARKLERLAVAATKREEGLWRGTVNGRRWFLGFEAAVEAQAELTADMRSPLEFLRDQGHAVYLLGRDDGGILGALGVSVGAAADAAKLAQVLGATLVPGLPDSTRGAVAKAAGLTSDGPPLGRWDATLLTQHAELPSSGARIRVLEPTLALELPAQASARALRSGLPALAEALPALPRLRREALRRAAVVALLPPVAAAGLAWLGWLGPGLGALLGLASVLWAGRAYGPVVGDKAGPAGEEPEEEEETDAASP
jgi:cation transport ATPase